MGEASRPAIFTIPVGKAFADTLVDGILARHRDDPMAVARGLILLPTNRAVQTVHNAFVRRANSGLLLPRMAAIGDIDLDDSIGSALESLDPAIPPAIDPLKRQAILAQLIQHAASEGGQPAMPAAAAMRLARELGRTRDQLLIEQIDPSRLADLGLGELAEHWSASLDKLNALLNAWPLLLAAKGAVDLAERRNMLLDRLAARWAATPPPGFVIAAGIDSIAPAIAGLLRTISRIPDGQVVFAALDAQMPDEEWEEIAGGRDDRSLDVHPQRHLQVLLTRMGAGKAEVQFWPGCKATAQLPRAQLARLTFLPAKFTGAWERREGRKALGKGVSAITLENPAEEAQAIALALRHAIETPAATAALITPDRTLATRVSALLERWGIAADDSAGTPLSVTQPGALMLALAEAAALRFAPVTLMALLKHPLVMGSDTQTRLDWLGGARRLDLALRGPRPGPGIEGITQFLADQPDHVRAAWQMVAPLLAPIDTGADTLASSVDQLIDVATALCGDGVWAGPAGRCLSEHMAAVRDGLADYPLEGGFDALPQLLRDRFDLVAVRPPAGGHPRIFIWGLIEARLQSADLVILGGMNEGAWPAMPAPDPWLAPAIRRSLGLPGIERRIGLAAHDFASALGAPQVLLTRARRDAASPTVASRFWLRVQTLTGGLTPPEPRFDELARALDHVAGTPARSSRPAPCPPVEDRPDSISVTAVDTLKADPYAYYARSMLKLSRIDPLDAEPTAQWRGTIIHDALQKWAEDDGYAQDALVARMEHILDGPEFHPLTRTLVTPQLVEAAQWAEAEVAQNHAEGRIPLKPEVKGKTQRANVLLHGRADRIDRTTEGLAIVDYKQGEAPGPKKVAGGFAMQLGLLGLIGEAGGFEDIDAARVTDFEYWSFARQPKTRAFGKVARPFFSEGKLKPGDPTPDDFIDRVGERFDAIVAKWLTGDEPFTAKRHPEHAYSDYDHLMRLEEWEGRG